MVEIDFSFSLSPRGITYDFENFQVTGQPEGDKRWRIIVSRNGSDLGLDVLSLESALGRKRLLDSLIGIHQVEREEIARSLLGIAPRLSNDYLQLVAEHRDEIEAEREAEASEERARQLAELEADILPLARDPALLFRASETIKNLGVAGEEANRPLVYTSMSSRLTEAPISLVIKGMSSTGKNNLVAKALELFQEGEHYIDLTSMSEKALIYDQRSYAHRSVIVFEVHGTEQADYFIRSLQSEGHLKHLTVIDGQSVLIDKPGPTNFLTTTTQAEINIENETRQFSVFVDDSEETTRGAKEVAAKEADGTATHPDVEPWRRFQEWLQLQLPYKVVIPYATFLARQTPNKPPRIRRDFRRLLEVIKAIVIIYQAQRQRNDEGNIIATVADFAMARPLVESLMRQAETGLNPKTRTIAEAVRDIYEEKMNKPERWATYKELTERTGLTKSVISTWVKPAYEEGFIENLEPGQGKKARLIPGAPLRDGAGLPAVEDVAREHPNLARETYIDPLTGEEIPLIPETVETVETVASEARNSYLKSTPEDRSDRDKTVETPRDAQAQAQNLGVQTVFAEPERFDSDSTRYLDETDRSHRSNSFDREGVIAYILGAAEEMDYPLDTEHRIGPGREAYEQRLAGMGDGELRALVEALDERFSE